MPTIQDVIAGEMNRPMTEADVRQIIEDMVHPSILGMGGDNANAGGEFFKTPDSEIYLGYHQGVAAWKTQRGVNSGAFSAVPRMFSAEVVGKKTLKIRDGIVRWSNVTLTTDVKSGDSGAIADGYFTLDMTAWTADEYRYAYMELDLNESYAYFRVTTDGDVPEDDPINRIVRWPLVKMLGKGTGDDFTAVIEDVCHEGIIKETGTGAPP